MKRLLLILAALPILLLSCTAEEPLPPETTATETTVEETSEAIPEELSISVAGADLFVFIKLITPVNFTHRAESL